MKQRVICRSPDIMGGTPVFCGTRVPVQTLLDYLEAGDSIDECLAGRLSRDLLGHEVKTARQLGWISIRNGELLTLAAQEFDVFVTVDRNLSSQQNLVPLTIAVIVLRAPTNRLAD